MGQRLIASSHEHMKYLKASEWAWLCLQGIPASIRESSKFITLFHDKIQSLNQQINDCERLSSLKNFFIRWLIELNYSFLITVLIQLKIIAIRTIQFPLKAVFVFTKRKMFRCVIVNTSLSQSPYSHNVDIQRQNNFMCDVEAKVHLNHNFCTPI